MDQPLFRVLAVLRVGSGDTGEILDRLRAIGSDATPSLPAFYRHLRRGMEEGWISIDGLDQGGEGPGRPRQIYALPRAGEESMRAEARRLEAFTSLALDPRLEDGS
jgi:DNA-binding PadR family transcriptional regulator